MSQIRRSPTPRPDDASQAASAAGRGPRDVCDPRSAESFRSLIKAKQTASSMKRKGKKGEKEPGSGSSPRTARLGAGRSHRRPIGRVANEGLGKARDRQQPAAETSESSRSGGAPAENVPLSVDAPSRLVATGEPGATDQASAASASQRTAALRQVSALVDRLVADVARAAEASALSSRPRLQVEVDLGRLGGGRVRVEKGRSGLEVRLEFDGTRARELAAAGLDDLRRALDVRGLDIARLEIPGTETLRQPPTSHRDRGQHGDGHPRDQGRGSREQGQGEADAAADEPEETT